MARQPLFVTGVAGLVHYAHQAGDKLLLVIACCDPHVGRHAATEGVTAHIEATVGEIKAEQSHYLLTERLLGRDGEGALRQQQGIALLLFTHGLDKSRQPAGQIAEDLIEPRAGHARLIERQHDVVGAHAKRIGPQLRYFTGEFHHFLEIGSKTGPVVVLALVAPGVLALAASERQRFDQLTGQQAGILPLALDLAEVGALHFIQRLTLGLGNPVAQLGSGALLVDQQTEFGHCFGAGIVAPFRHHGRLIPAADGGEVAKAVDLLLMLFKLLI